MECSTFFVFKKIFLSKKSMSRCYTLSDLIDIVEELLATCKGITSLFELRDPRDRYSEVVRRELVIERLELMLDQVMESTKRVLIN